MICLALHTFQANHNPSEHREITIPHKNKGTIPSMRHCFDRSNKQTMLKAYASGGYVDVFILPPPSGGGSDKTFRFE